MVAAPVQVLEAEALPDSGAGLGEAGLAAPGEVWLIRPDAHTAAVLHGPGRAEIVAALRRALALPEAVPARGDALLASTPPPRPSSPRGQAPGPHGPEPPAGSGPRSSVPGSRP